MKKILIFTIILLPMILMFCYFPNVLAQDDTSQKNYTFNDEILIDDTNLVFDKYYNVRHPQSFTDIYNGTYSFTNDSIWSNPYNWTINEGGGSVNVIDILDGHNKIVELNRTGATTTSIKNTFGSIQTYGTIEYWCQTNDTTGHLAFYIQSGTTICIQVQIATELFTTYDTDWRQITNALDDNWYHIRIDFECGANTYQGLAPDTFFIYVNGTKYGAYNFRNVITSIDNILILNSWSTTINYIDAIGYSWSTDYNIGDNVIPYSYENTSYLEPDTEMFDLNDDKVYYQNDDELKNGWTIGSDLEAKMINDNDDCYVSLYKPTAVAGAPVSRDISKIYPFYPSDNIIIVSINFSVNSWESGASFRFFFRESSLTGYSVYARIKSDGGGTHGIFNYFSAGFTEYATTMYFLPNRDYQLFFYLNFDTEYCTLTQIENNVYNESSIFPLWDTTPNLRQIVIGNGYTINKAYSFVSYLKGVGLYSNSTSYSNTNAYLRYDLNNNEWNSQHHNLLTIENTGILSESDLYVVNQYFNNSAFLSSISFNDSILSFNLYELSFYIELPNLLFFINESFSDFSLDYLKIFGSSLIEGSNKYWLKFTYGNVDIDKNYFYVDSLNRLQFNLITNDNNTEYIQASFDVDTVSTNNRFLSFRSNLFGESIGTFRLQYATISNLVVLDYLDRSYYLILTQNQEVDKIILLITDNDLKYSGSNIGYFSNIKLRYSDTQTTIITLMLVSMLIPLIMILIPSISISNIYSKNLLIPLFLLMSLICTFSFIIPTWLFFIIGICCVIFLFTKQEQIKEGF